MRTVEITFQTITKQGQIIRAKNSKYDQEMGYEQKIKTEVKSHLDDVLEETDIENRDLREVVEECVTVDESWPMRYMTATEFNASSRKPSNIKVEFDIEASFEILAQSGYLSDDEIGVFAAICALCALVSRKTKIDLEPETGFVYWVAYDNQQNPWEIPKQELVELAIKKSNTMDVHFELTKSEVERRIQLLCNINSFTREIRDREYIILRELCSSDWS